MEIPDYYRRLASLEGYSEQEQNAALQDFLTTGGQNLDPRATAWCAAAVNAALEQSGVPGTGSLAARSFLNWGSPVDQPQVGDVAVFSRPNAGPSAGHVGFYAGQGPDGQIRVLGGNQGDSVSYSNYPADRLLGYRRPGVDVRMASTDEDWSLPTGDPVTGQMDMPMPMPQGSLPPTMNAEEEQPGFMESWLQNPLTIMGMTLLGSAGSNNPMGGLGAGMALYQQMQRAKADEKAKARGDALYGRDLDLRAAKMLGLEQMSPLERMTAETQRMQAENAAQGLRSKLSNGVSSDDGGRWSTPKNWEI